jgi:hypothetical protein
MALQLQDRAARKEAELAKAEQRLRATGFGESLLPPIEKVHDEKEYADPNLSSSMRRKSSASGGEAFMRSSSSKKMWSKVRGSKKNLLGETRRTSSAARTSSIASAGRRESNA